MLVLPLSSIIILGAQTAPLPSQAMRKFLYPRLLLVASGDRVLHFWETRICLSGEHRISTSLLLLCRLSGLMARTQHGSSLMALSPPRGKNGIHDPV